MEENYKKLLVNINDDHTYDVYIGRPSKFGNPYSHIPNSNAKFIVDSREDAINAYKYHLLFENSKLFDLVKKELKNKVLACHCYPLSCHGEFLIEIANSDKNIEYYKKQLLDYT